MLRRVWAWPRHGRGPGLAGLLLLALFLQVGFDAINGLAAMRTGAALAHGNDVLNLESHLHISVEVRASRWLVHHTVLARTANWIYNLCQAFVTSAVLVVLWWRRPAAYQRLRWVILGANLVALAVFWVYPVAPPRLLPGRGVVDVVAVVAVPFGWKPGILPGDPGQFQALPSLHAAWATWVALAGLALASAWWGRALAVAYPVFVGVLVVVTGTHSVLDVVTGTVMVLIVVAVVMEFGAWNSASSPNRSRARPTTTSSPRRWPARQPASARSSGPTTS